ncbi:hypothetical protein [Laceyella putida]|uniref:DUF11 domain-containing protein n=1 Tax=Laceyella putida TaxID=110101 RepID=A0ABW2RKV8_9BACL
MNRKWPKLKASCFKRGCFPHHKKFHHCKREKGLLTEFDADVRGGRSQPIPLLSSATNGNVGFSNIFEPEIAQVSVCLDDRSDRVWLTGTVVWAGSGTGGPDRIAEFFLTRTVEDGQESEIFSVADNAPAGGDLGNPVTTTFTFVDEDPINTVCENVVYRLRVRNISTGPAATGENRTITVTGPVVLTAAEIEENKKRRIHPSCCKC